MWTPYPYRLPTQRRAAAQWEYDSAMADDILATALSRRDPEEWLKSRLKPGVLALAIDPLFAPALLTVGSLEYQMAGACLAKMKAVYQRTGRLASGYG